VAGLNTEQPNQSEGGSNIRPGRSLGSPDERTPLIPRDGAERRGHDGSLLPSLQDLSRTRTKSNRISCDLVVDSPVSSLGTGANHPLRSCDDNDSPGWYGANPGRRSFSLGWLV
jgi:hypothetical protein